jgi:ubiquinone/menaquinone biosynthesis C-methylase UbiE
MVNAPDEAYYAEQYWRVIIPSLKDVHEEAQCLDLGCSQGRFSLRMAKHFPQGKILACDFSESAILAARRNADDATLSNIEFRAESIRQMLRSCASESQHIVMMTEVTFFYPEWRAQMPEILRVLRPGGLLVMSFRSQYFDALCLARARLWHNADMLIDQRRGRLFDSQLEYSWQTSQEIRSLLIRDCGLDLLELFGVGVCSGIPGDPHERIMRPCLIDPGDRDHLMRLEMALGGGIPDAGRYILALAHKKNNSTGGKK